MDRFRRTLLVLTTVLVVGASNPVFVSQDVTLRLRFTEGEELAYRTVQDSTVEMRGLPGMDGMSMTSSMTQVQRFVTESVAEDGAATIRAFVESMKVAFTSPAGTVSYDSSTPETATGDPMARQVAQTLGVIVGKPVTTVIEPTGSVRSVSGVTDLTRSMQAANPQAAQAMGGLGGMEQLMSDEGMKAAFGQTFSVLPLAAVKVGGSWTSTLTMPNPIGPMTMTTTFTLVGLDTIDAHPVARIATATVITTAPTQMAGPIPAQIEVYDAFAEGEVLFDPAAGRVSRATSRMTIPMAMTMTAPDGSTLGIDSVVRSTTTVELVER